MPSRKRRRREEILARIIRIDSVELCVSLSRNKQRGLPPPLDSGASLMFRGSADEPVRDVSAFTVSLHLQDTEEPQWTNPLGIGSIIQVRPSVYAVVWIPQRAFDHVWALASSGQLRRCHLAFATPKRGAAVVVSASFSNDREGDPLDPRGAAGSGAPVEPGGVPTDQPEQGVP